MSGETTAIYSALLALIFAALSVRSLYLRRHLGIGVGTGNDPQLIKALRAHSNFIEYTPLCLILLYFLETVLGATSTVHIYGLMLIFGRSIHAFGISQVEENYNFRVIGMFCTLFVLISSSISILRAALQS